MDMLALSVYMDEWADIPSLLVNHNVESVRLYRWFLVERNPVKKAFLGLQCLKLRRFERTMCNRCDCVVAVSETDREELEKMGVRSKIFVVPNGTDTNVFRPDRNAESSQLVLWFGHMDVHTNEDAVLYFWKKICPHIKSGYREAKVMFVGTKPPREIEEAAARGEDIEVTGFVDDVKPYIAKASVVVVPIRIGSGTRIKILDAMAMGKAVVSTSVGCEGLNVKSGEDILIADDPIDFAHKTIMLLKDRDYRERIQRGARKTSEMYDWEIMREKQEASYRFAVDPSG
jgi:glycosyltransferase involved in cell wall biosynthesis